MNVLPPSALFPRLVRVRRVPARARQSGIGLLELLVVIAISLFMLAGLFSMVYGTRQNFLAQNQLAQLQDSERLAMNLVTNVVQTAGYFPNPATSTSTQALPVVTGVFATAGQSVYGTTPTTGDQLAIRYVAGSNDGVMDCNGQTNGSGASQTDINLLYVDVVNKQLVCQVTANGVAGAANPLVSGVSGMAVLYGVDTNGDGAVDQYMTATQVNTANSWLSVLSVRVTLTFSYQLAGMTAGSATNTVQLTRNIDLLNRT